MEAVFKEGVAAIMGQQSHQVIALLRPITQLTSNPTAWCPCQWWQALRVDLKVVPSSMLQSRIAALVERMLVPL